MDFLYFFKEGLSCTMVIRTVKEEMGSSLNLLAATKNKIYTILKIVPKFMINPSLIFVRNFNPSLLSTLNT